jgi:CHAT domain-containing protein
MKKPFLFIAILIAFQSASFSQTTDSLTVSRQIDSLINLSEPYLKPGKFEEGLAYIDAAEQLAKEKLGTNSRSYSKCLFQRGRFSDMMGKIPLTLELWSQSLSILEQTGDTSSLAYANMAYSLGLIYNRTGKPDVALPLFFKAMGIREKELGKEHLLYTLVLIGLGNSYVSKGESQIAERYYTEARDTYERTTGKRSNEYAGSLSSLGIVCVETGRYEIGASYFRESARIRKEILGPNHPAYINSLMNLGICYRSQGKYESAESAIMEGMQIIENNFGREHPNYVMGIYNISSVYIYMHMEERALILCEEGRRLCEKMGLTTNPIYFAILSNIASSHKGLGDVEKSIPVYREVRTIYAKSSGETHPEYAVACYNLADAYARLGDWETNKQILSEALAVYENIPGKENLERYAETLYALGIAYRETNNFQLAESYTLQSLKLLANITGREHTRYYSALNNLSTLYFKYGKTEPAAMYFEESMALLPRFFQNAARHSAENDMLSFQRYYTEHIDAFYSFMLKTAPSPRLSERAYDCALLSKSFLLEGRIDLQNALTRADEATKNTYFTWLGVQRKLAEEYSKPLSGQTRLEPLEKQAENLEKELVLQIRDFADSRRAVSWQEVQKSLQPGEAAVEFLRFNLYTPALTDSVMYAALILKPGAADPIFIPLFEERAIQQSLSSRQARRFEYVNALYSGVQLFNFIWAPLEAHLQGVRSVYYSPAGLLHRVQLSALPTGNGQYLSDQYQLTQLGSTRQLAKPAEKTGASRHAMAFGGIQYDMDGAGPASQEENAKETFAPDRGIGFFLIDSTLRTESWSPLKWAEKEAATIAAILGKAGFRAEVAKGAKATEELFKKLGDPADDQSSPGIIHLSTHGYFFPDPENSRQASGETTAFTSSEHPLIRSGLILAGGNYAWKAGLPRKPGMEDGILTAYEISQLDLRGTELAVLSACDTGLGDIKGNEGVYGLQRAFRLAGVRYVLMSLWQVPDFQTQELMTAFYQNWLEKKMPIRQALLTAQEAMRKKGYEPYYWAGFVLVE